MKIRCFHHIIYALVLPVVCQCCLTGCNVGRDNYDWSSGGDDSIYAEAKKKKKKKAEKNRKEKPKENKRGRTVRGDSGARSTPTVSAEGTARDVIDAAMAWMGTPYSYGGNTRGGTDCSGLTCMAFERGAGIKLPRSSREQADYSRRIRRGDLQPGDLVFFTNRRGGTRINHVAIYIGDNRIVHATTSLGVTVSSLDEPYWDSHYHSCGRVL